MKIQAVGIPWYRKEDYHRIISISKDAYKFAPRYEDWLAAAEEACRLHQAKGIRVIRAEIDPDEFPAWCAANGVNIDSEGRNLFANEAAFQAIQKQTEN